MFSRQEVISASSSYKAEVVLEKSSSSSSTSDNVYGAVIMTPSYFKSSPGARFTKYLTTILRLSYDNAKVTYDGRLIYTTSYNEWKAFHR